MGGWLSGLLDALLQVRAYTEQWFAKPPVALRCSIGQADVTANVYVRFDFVYDK